MKSEPSHGQKERVGFQNQIKLERAERQLGGSPGVFVANSVPVIQGSFGTRWTVSPRERAAADGAQMGDALREEGASLYCEAGASLTSELCLCLLYSVCS